MERVLVVIVLLGAALAGCLGGDAVEADGDAPAGADGAPDELEDEDAVLAGKTPAEWAPGHYWSYKTSFDTEFALVVSHDHGDDWFIDTTSPDTAWFHHRDAISFLGEIRKSDLAGSQGSDRVKFLDFPLEEGKQWSTSWDGAQRQITVVEAGKVFRLEAHDGDRLAVSYTYDPVIGWFSETTFHNEDGTFSMSLGDHRAGWSGDVYRWEGAMVSSYDHPGPPPHAYYGTFTVSEGTGELWAEVAWTCSGLVGVTQFTLMPVPPDPEGYMVLGECENLQEVFIIADPVAGDWYSSAGYMSDDPEATISAEVWMRTLITNTAPY